MLNALERHMSFPSDSTDEIKFDGGYITYTSQKPLSSYKIYVETKYDKFQLGENLRERYFRNYGNFSPPGVLGHYFITPDKRVEAKPYVEGDILYMPFGYASDFTVSEDGGTLTLNSR